MMVSEATDSIDACAAHYGDDSEAMRAYLIEGQSRAYQLDNRGPIEFEADGTLSKHIRDLYSQYGFYIFEGVVPSTEIEDLRRDLKKMRARFPACNGSSIDAQGEKALGVDNKGPNLIWAKPLADPLGGTPLANGRHQVKLFEPTASSEAPDFAPFILLGPLQFSDACLRLYGHPDLLKVAAAINGEDFAPFNESIFMKDPGLGAAVSWHQDGDTHWNNPDFDEDIHGFNFMAQIYSSTVVNGVWVVPGTHKTGRADIKKIVENAGSERLPGAVPIVCEAGDVVICNRQVLHGSFANTGFEPRLSVHFGFHRRSSVLNVQGAGIHTTAAVYDDARIKERSKMIAFAIDARRQKYQEETPYEYQPLAGEQYSFTPKVRESLKDYNILDLSI